jgi:flagellar biosynthesis/type III secretory pathway protein FliH
LALRNAGFVADSVNRLSNIDPGATMTQGTETSAAPREARLSELLESAKAGQHAANDAVRNFINTVDDAIRERRNAIREDSALHSLRQTIVDAALEMAEKLITTQYEFHRSLLRTADRALSKPEE